jgi:hypothetical protein
MPDDGEIGVDCKSKITLSLGATYTISGLRYQPRNYGSDNGIITAYNVYVSTDGAVFTQVASGTWAQDTKEKTVSLMPVSATQVRLEATAGYAGFASAGEINVESHCSVPTCTAEGNAYAPTIDIKPQGADDLIMYDQIYFDNNTIISGQAYGGYSGILVETCSSMTNLYARNNIIQGFSYNIGSTSIDGSTFYVQDNLYYSNGTDAVGYGEVAVGGINFVNVAPGNPLFAGSSDYHLAAGSPAIGAGIHITTPPISTDYAGKTVANPPAIGAYEY